MDPQGAIIDLAFGYVAAGGILSMTDAVHPDRSQSFTYDAVSRLTSAEGGYGEIDYTLSCPLITGPSSI